MDLEWLSDVIHEEEVDNNSEAYCCACHAFDDM